MEPLFDYPADQIDDATTDRWPCDTVVETPSISSFLSRLSLAAEAEGISCLAPVGKIGKPAIRSNAATVSIQTQRFVCGSASDFLSRMPDAERLAKLKQFAESKGGECLETAWLGGGVRHRSQCARGWLAR